MVYPFLEKTMETKTLLAKAKRCKTEGDAEKLLNTLERDFGKLRPVTHLDQANSEAYLEAEGKPFVRFEMNRVISDDYITMIRPEIRDEELVVTVATNRMLDGRGMMSKSWETVEGMDDLVESYPGRTVRDMVERAVQLAISHHRLLIERVGVPQQVAETAAKECW